MALSEITKAKQLWRKIAKDVPENDYQFELEIHRKLLNVFHPGNYYYYILNCTTAKIELVSESVSSVLGYAPDEFQVEFIMGTMHPNDLVYFIPFEQKVTEFFNNLPTDKMLKYKVNYDFRLKASNGSYIRILHQAAAVQTDKYRAVIRVLGIHTDITKLKTSSGAELSFIGL